MQADRHETAGPDERRWVALSVLLIANFMNLMDVTIVNVSLPSLRRDLGASASDIEWVVAAYIIAFALGLLPFGRLGDTIGRRRMFIAGVTLFTLFSALCGLAPSIGVLIAGRVLQGAAAAMMTPQTLAIAQVIFPPSERGSAFALFGVAASLAAVSGPVIGGLLIGADLWGLEWRPIFLVNIPIGILAVTAGLRFIPPIPGHRALGIDIVGIALAAVTLFLVIFPAIEGRSAGWPLWCLAMLAAALPGTVLFILWERRQRRLSAPQLLPPDLLARRGYATSSAIVAIFFSAMPGFFLVVAIFLQEGYGLTPLQSGLTTVPFPAGILCASFVSRMLSHRYARTRLAGGVLVMVAAYFVLRLLVGDFAQGSDRVLFLAPLFCAGLGMGTAIGPLYQLGLAGIPSRDAGSASGGLQSFQQVGAALGVALIAEIFFAVLGAGSYVPALRMALVYEMAAYATVALLALTLPPLAAPAPAAANVEA